MAQLEEQTKVAFELITNTKTLLSMVEGELHNYIAYFSPTTNKEKYLNTLWEFYKKKEGSLLDNDITTPIGALDYCERYANRLINMEKYITEG